MELTAPPLPYRTHALPGIGGRIRTVDADFAVDEVPAYPPSGDGDHVFVHIEKRGLTTVEAVRRLAVLAQVPAKDIGWAGMKDRHAVTRQWLSLPPPARPEAVLDRDTPELTVLAAVRHRHKLRTGHLRGNRFTLIVREVGEAAEAATRARAVLDALAAGAPNWYGEQRFGARGDNATTGLALLRAGGRGGGAPRHKRLLISALQSHLFNAWLAARERDGLATTVLAGDLLQKLATGGMFASADPAVDQARLDAGELVITGPMFGATMRAPLPDSPAWLREAATLAEVGLATDAFVPIANLAPGTRRAAAIHLGQPEVAVVAPDAISVSFSLPAGAYATAILRELQKHPEGFGAGPAADPRADATAEPSAETPEDLE